MQKKITAVIKHMAASHIQMARMLEAKQHMAEHASGLVQAVPDQETTFDGREAVMQHVLGINKSVAAYLNSIADLEDAIADNLAAVMKELDPQNEE